MKTGSVGSDTRHPATGASARRPSGTLPGGRGEERNVDVLPPPKRRATEADLLDRYLPDFPLAGADDGTTPFTPLLEELHDRLQSTGAGYDASLEDELAPVVAKGVKVEAAVQAMPDAAPAAAPGLSASRQANGMLVAANLALDRPDPLGTESAIVRTLLDAQALVAGVGKAENGVSLRLRLAAACARAVGKGVGLDHCPQIARAACEGLTTGDKRDTCKAVVHAIAQHLGPLTPPARREGSATRAELAALRFAIEHAQAVPTAAWPALMSTLAGASALAYGADLEGLAYALCAQVVDMSNKVVRDGIMKKVLRPLGELALRGAREARQGVATEGAVTMHERMLDSDLPAELRAQALSLAVHMISELPADATVWLRLAKHEFNLVMQGLAPLYNPPAQLVAARETLRVAR
jgi:hypothetical protein